MGDMADALTDEGYLHYIAHINDDCGEYHRCQYCEEESMAEDKVFVDGVIFKKPHQNAPDFVKGSLSLKMSDLTEFAKKHHKDGWLNIDLLESRNGKYYAALNTFEPKKGSRSPDELVAQPQQTINAPQSSSDDPFNDDIPW